MPQILSCPECDGEGRVEIQSGGWHAPHYRRVACEACAGSGKQGCSSCRNDATRTYAGTGCCEACYDQALRDEYFSA